MNVLSMARNKSGSACSRCSDRNRAGSILWFAVIAWCSFVDFGRSLKDHAVAASHHDATLNNAAPSYTTSVDSTPPQRCSAKPHGHRGGPVGVRCGEVAYK